MKFSNGDFAKIVNTGSKLDGTNVCIIGCSFYCGPEVGSVYIIRRGFLPNNETFQTHNGEWTAMIMTESCLEKVYTK